MHPFSRVSTRGKSRRIEKQATCRIDDDDEDGGVGRSETGDGGACYVITAAYVTVYGERGGARPTVAM